MVFWETLVTGKLLAGAKVLFSGWEVLPSVVGSKVIASSLSTGALIGPAILGKLQSISLVPASQAALDFLYMAPLLAKGSVSQAYSFVTYFPFTKYSPLYVRQLSEFRTMLMIAGSTLFTVVASTLVGLVLSARAKLRQGKQPKALDP